MKEPVYNNIIKKDEVHITAKNGQKLILNQNHYYVDGSLDKDPINNYIFKTIHSAVSSSINGTESDPMIIYIEPDVYQMNGTAEDRGLYIDKDWISFIGLTSDPQDVVIADNRGHTIGTYSTTGSSPAETLFITGTGFHAENLTIGNYCNVDLIYPRDTSKNQRKVSSTITQAYCIGAYNDKKTLDKYYFRNVRFISMLDTVALGSVQRVYYEDCYVQGTDDFMGGGMIHVMKNTTLHCYSSKPIYSAGKYGMAFINCKWKLDFVDQLDLYIAKNSSTIYLIDCSFVDLNDKLKSIHWAPYPSIHIKSYSYETTLNGKPYTILPQENGIKLSTMQLSAYSSYTFLKGIDDWDPAHEKESFTLVEDLPINISISPDASVRTGKESIQLTANIFPATAKQNLTWSIDSTYAILTSIQSTSVIIKGNNSSESPKDVIVTATAHNGISNQTFITVHPSYVHAPKFTKLPVLIGPIDGKVTVDYTLDLAYSNGIRSDESHITWYRCDDEAGRNPLKIAVSRLNMPLTSYSLSTGDIGHYIMVSVTPKHLRSLDGEPVASMINKVISIDDLMGTSMEKYSFTTDFKNIPTMLQPKLIPGTWTLDSYYPLDQYIQWDPSEKSPWEYNVGINGAAGTYGLLTVGRGARLLYTQDGNFRDMAIHLTLNTEKTAAQGFGSPNGQYFEVYIKYDTRTKTGYGLRIERTTKYGFATDFTLYEYSNGRGKAITQSISATAFNPRCTIDLSVNNNVLSAFVTSKTPQSADQLQAGLPSEVSFAAEIAGNPYGGMGVQHTGSSGPESRIQLNTLSVSY